MNCTNTLFRSFDEFHNEQIILGERKNDQKIKQRNPGFGLGATWPIFSKGALKSRGLIQKESVLPNLDQEFKK